MRFSYELQELCVLGTLLESGDYVSFQYKWTEPLMKLSGAMSKKSMRKRIFRLAFDTLEVCVSMDSKKLLYLEGYFPRATWIKRALPCPETVQGHITLITERELFPKRLKHMEGSEDWIKYYDETRHWIYFGPEDIQVGDVNVEFAKDVVAGITRSQIVSLWLHPVNLRPKEPAMARWKAFLKDHYPSKIK